MTLECSSEQFWGVAFLVTGAQPAMAMKSALSCVVADVLECFAKVKADVAMIQRIGTCPLSYGSLVVTKKMNILLLIFLGF